MSNDQDMLFCKDCIHSTRPWHTILFMDPSYMNYRCKLTRRREVVQNLVTGKIDTKITVSFCDNERRYGDCGLSGKNWKPKHKKDLFKFFLKEDT